MKLVLSVGISLNSSSRWIDLKDAFQYIASSEPSSNLLTLLRSFNPELLFKRLDSDVIVDMVLNWLTVRVASSLLL